VWQNDMKWVDTYLESDFEYQRRKSRAGDADDLPEEAGDAVAEEVGVRD